MGESTGRTTLFEVQRPHLRSVAYQMLGSVSDADDAVQEAWIRFDRTDTSEVGNLPGWLTTVVARVSLNMLRARKNRSEHPWDEQPMPDPIVDAPDSIDPEHEALVADSVGLALLVILETLSPPERLAFVLHDVFSVPFDEIAALIDRSPDAARQLASRARRRVRGAVPEPDASFAAQREVVDAFFAAGRDGDFERLVAVLDPDVVLRADFGAGGRITTRSARDVAGRASRAVAAAPGQQPRPALVNGAPGMVIFERDRPVSVMAFTLSEGRISAIDVLGDPVRLANLDLRALSSTRPGTPE